MLCGLHQVNPLPKLSLIYTLKWQPQTKGKRGTLAHRACFCRGSAHAQFPVCSQAAWRNSFCLHHHLEVLMDPSSQRKRSCSAGCPGATRRSLVSVGISCTPARPGAKLSLAPSPSGLCRQGGLSWRPPWSQHFQHSMGKSQLTKIDCMNMETAASGTHELRSARNNC